MFMATLPCLGCVVFVSGHGVVGLSIQARGGSRGCCRSRARSCGWWSQGEVVVVVKSLWSILIFEHIMNVELVAFGMIASQS